MSEHILNATDVDFESKVLQADGPVVVDFWAPWCGPCRAQAPILERFASANADVTVVKVNVDESPRVASTYGIRSIPTIAVFEGGNALLGAAGVQNEKRLGALVVEARKHATG